MPNQKGNVLLKLVIAAVILVLLVVGLWLALAASLGVKNSSSVNEVLEKLGSKAGKVTIPYTTENPSKEKTPEKTPEQPATPKKSTTLEEAVLASWDAIDSKYKDTARLSYIKVLYTPDHKQWSFTFKSKTNPHTNDSKEVIDIVPIRIRMAQNGDFSLDDGSITKDVEPITWENLPLDLKDASTLVIDQAKDKVTAAGYELGETVLAEFDTGYRGNERVWDVHLVLKGEEESSPKKAKLVTFKDGKYTGLSDSTVIIY